MEQSKATLRKATRFDRTSVGSSSSSRASPPSRSGCTPCSTRTARANLVFLIGLLLWPAIVVVISILASVLPARRAWRLSVREVLAYE
jgi:hypothetical protein